jgi:hypothetical protein
MNGHFSNGYSRCRLLNGESVDGAENPGQRKPPERGAQTAAFIAQCLFSAGAYVLAAHCAFNGHLFAALTRRRSLGSVK